MSEPERIELPLHLSSVEIIPVLDPDSKPVADKRVVGFRLSRPNSLASVEIFANALYQDMSVIEIETEEDDEGDPPHINFIVKVDELEDWVGGEYHDPEDLEVESVTLFNFVVGSLRKIAEQDED